jgi:hypothetical protein
MRGGETDNDNDEVYDDDDTAQTILYTKCYQSHPQLITIYSSKCSHVSEYQN